MVHFFLKPFNLFGKLVDKTMVVPSNKLLSTSPRFTSICPCAPEFPQSIPETSNNTFEINESNPDTPPPKYEDIYGVRPQGRNIQTGSMKGQIESVEESLQSLHISGRDSQQNVQVLGEHNVSCTTIPMYENTRVVEGPSQGHFSSSSSYDIRPSVQNCKEICLPEELEDRKIVKLKIVKRSERMHMHHMSHYERRMEKKLQRANNKVERKARKLDRKMKQLELKKQTILKIYNVPEQF